MQPECPPTGVSSDQTLSGVVVVVVPTLFGVLWDNFNSATASTCICCNQTNAGIQFTSMHRNTLHVREHMTPVVRLDDRSQHQAEIWCLLIEVLCI